MADSTALSELTRNFLIIFNQREKGTQATRGYNVLVLLLRELDCEIARLHPALEHQLIGNAYKVQTLSQQVRAETAAIQSGISHRKQQPTRKVSRPRR